MSNKEQDAPLPRRGCDKAVGYRVWGLGVGVSASLDARPNWIPSCEGMTRFVSLAARRLTLLSMIAHPATPALNDGHGIPALRVVRTPS